MHGIDRLSEQKRQQVLSECVHDLAERADHFLERYPLKHESYTFKYEYALIDGGMIHYFRFIADGSDRQMGVIQVIYVDHEAMPLAP